jgi:hypothetical protein
MTSRRALRVKQFWLADRVQGELPINVHRTQYACSVPMRDSPGKDKESKWLPAPNCPLVIGCANKTAGSIANKLFECSMVPYH